MADPKVICIARALYEFQSSEPHTLQFRKGDNVEVLGQLDVGWWDGVANGRRGWFPSNYVEIIDNHDSEEEAVSEDETDARMDVWTPKIAANGAIFYLNAVTGETLWDLPLNRSNGMATNVSRENTAIRSPERIPVSSNHNRMSPEVEKQPPKMSDLPPNWVQKRTPRGRVYYYNTVSEETTWNIDDVYDDGDTQMNTNSHTGNDISSPQSPSDPMVQQEPPQHHISSNHASSNQDGARQTHVHSTPSPTNHINSADEPVSWPQLNTQIAVAIKDLRQAVEHGEKDRFDACANKVILSIRGMLHACDCMDKDSVYFRQDRVLKTQRRAITATLSRLTLSAKMATGICEPETIARLKEDAQNVLVTVRKFVLLAQECGVEVFNTHPYILTTEEAARSTLHSQNFFFSQSVSSTSSPSEDLESSQAAGGHANHRPGLLDQLENHSNLIEKVIHHIQNDVQAALTEQCLKSIHTLSVQTALIMRVQEISYLLNSFLNLVEEAKLLRELPVYTELQCMMQALYNHTGKLILEVQMSTNQNISCEMIVADQISETVDAVQNGVQKLLKRINAIPEMHAPPPVNGNGKHRRHRANHPSDELSDDFISSDSEVSARKNSTLNGDEKSSLEIAAHDGLDASATVVSAVEAGALPVFHSPRPDKLRKFFGEDPMPTPSNEQSYHLFDAKIPYLGPDIGPDELIFTGDGHVKGGTLRGLVERLTLHDQHDASFNATFLLTYRSFTRTEIFLDMLCQRFLLKPPPGLSEEELATWIEKKQTPVRLRVFNVLKNWLENYFMDAEDIRYLPALKEFALKTMQQHMSMPASQLIKLIDKRISQPDACGIRKMVANASINIPLSILPRNLQRIKLEDLDNLEIARQLTLMDARLFNRINPVECLNKIWSAEDSTGNIAENVKALIEQSNQMTCWVAESILSQIDMKKRVSLIKRFVAIAEKCRTLNNFNTCMAIVAGLDSSAIFRLKRTWELVNQKTMLAFSQLKKLMSSAKNFGEYRRVLKASEPPCVPFLGVYLTDLTFIEDGNPDSLKRSHELINFAKYTKTAEVIRELQRYQITPYSLAPVPEIQLFLRKCLQSARAVEELYPLSLSLEPREREDEKIARLLNESGFV
ncbi:uncharacterized protein VTP21DRAFT_11036 [Calcarisporiella thermophila]|uniref:uncharacterized protein n=1 Tax=Calcarisporiella thermophila TaxID=911321 RepID=UPI003743A1F9